MQSRGSLKYILPVSLALLLSSAVLLQAAPQRPDSSGKPVLIREPEKTEAENAEPPHYDQSLAEKELEIANYYFKRKNYNAAINRCLRAIKYRPDYADAYRLLGRAYEKNKDYAGAISAYKKYISQYPNSTAAEEFNERIAELKGRGEKAKETGAQNPEPRH